MNGPILYSDLRVVRGSDAQYDYTWFSGGVPVDLTGYSATLKARATESLSSPAVVSLVSPTNITLGASGGIVVTITAAQSAVIPVGTYFYNMLFVDTIGKTFPFMEGKLTVGFSPSQ